MFVARNYGMAEKKKIFISYKRNVEPDEPIALEVFSQLSQDYDVFIDLKMMVGTKWSKEIQNNLLESDCFISLISENSIKSEMVSTEILLAYKQAKATGSPLILPVRLNYFGDLDYDLMAYLGSSNYIAWRSYSDTQSVIKQLRLAIDGHKLSDDKVLDFIKQREKNKENLIRKLLSGNDFDKALSECEKVLEQNPDARLIHLLLAIAMLKGRGANTFSTSLVNRIEKHLESAVKDNDLRLTVLVVWGIIKHDHYFLNGLRQVEPSLDNIKKSLSDLRVDSLDIDLVELVKTDFITYKALGLQDVLKNNL